MSRPNPANPVSPLIQLKIEMQSYSDEQLLELERDLKSKVNSAEDLDNQRVSVVFKVISEEKSSRGL